MQIRILVLAGLLALAQMQARAADQLIRLPKPSELERATKGKIGKPAQKPAEASAQASAAAGDASASAASQPAASAAASTPTPVASAPSSAASAPASSSPSPAGATASASKPAAASQASASASQPSTAAAAGPPTITLTPSSLDSPPKGAAASASASAPASASASAPAKLPASAATSAAAASSPAASAPAASAKASASVPASASASAAQASASASKPGAKPAPKDDEEMDATDIAQRISAKLAELRKQRDEKLAAQKKAAKSRKRTKITREPPPPPEIHWSYEGEGAPANWGKINAANFLCDFGKRQSPIDIRDGIRVDLERINFDYKPSRFNVVDNGHTIQVNMGVGNTITVGGRSYELMQFHFHHPSEERVNGKGFPMVAHLVHKDAEGRLAVVALLIDEGGGNEVLQQVWNNLPLEKNDPMLATISLDLAKLLPARRDYYTYMGSLTTPPCSEGVLWLVMKEPIQMSPQQIAIFSKLYPMNARPIQNVAGRMIKESN